MVQGNSHFFACWRTQTTGHLFFTAISFISEPEKLFLSSYTACDDVLCSCSSPSADPRGYPHHSAERSRGTDFAPKSHMAASSQCCMQNNQKACTLCCGDEIWASTYGPSLKTLPCAPSPSVDLPFPCPYQ